MKRKITSAAAGALLLLTLAAAACGETQAGEPPWEAVPLPLGEGHTYAAYDAQRDVIWLLNWDLTASSPPGEPNIGAASLARLELESRRFDRYLLAGSTNGLGLGAGLAVDGQGAVWAAWGHRLIRLDPASGETEGWVIPQPDAAALAGYDATTEGMAVDLAVGHGGRVWVALDSASTAMALDPATGAWSSVDTAPLMGTARSQLTFAADGKLLLNGVIRGHPDLGNVPGGGSGMVSIDPVAGEATLTDFAAFTYSVRVDGTVDYVDADTGEVRRLTVGGGDSATSARFALDSLYPIRQVMAGDGADSLWFWTTGYLSLDIVRVDAQSGEASSYPYPLIISTLGADRRLPFSRGLLNPSGPEDKELAHSPEIHGLLVDKRGDVWVVSANTKVYPALYRLHVE